MKNIKIITLFLLGLLVLISCDEDEYKDYTAPDELSDVSWIISLGKYEEDPFSVNEDTFMAFFDISQGAVSHEWIINEGNYFLNEGFTANDTLANFINYEKGLSTTDGKAFVYFEKSGLNTVRLLNKFTEPVSYKSSEGVYNAVPEGDLWVIDTTFTFDVYANLKPAFTVFQDDNVILDISAEDMSTIEDEASWPVVDVEAGASLTFIDNTTIGRPNGRNWIIPDGVIGNSNNETTIAKFFKLGLYEVGSLKSIRVKPLPTANATKLIPLKVNVIPSSQPFVFDGNLAEAEDQKISFRVSGEVAPFSGQESNFTVHVTNAAANFDSNITVQNAKVDPNNATFIQLTLSEPIYNSDEITVAYSGNEIESTDTRVLEAFDPKPVTMYFSNNILAADSWSGFELTNGSLNRAYAWEYYVGSNGTAEDPNWSRTEERFFAGTSSMKFSVESFYKDNFNLFGFNLGTGVDQVPAATYQISYMVYLEPGNTLDNFTNEIGGVYSNYNITDTPRGEWVKVQSTIVVNSDIVSRTRIALGVSKSSNPNAQDARQTMYFDQLSLIPLEIRP